MVFVIMLAVFSAVAAGAEVDRDFGDGGQVVLRGPRPPFHMALGDDGSIALSSSGAVTRLLPSGQPDADFGAEGTRPLESVDGIPFQPSGLATDSQGRVLVFGTATDPAQEKVEVAFLKYVSASWAAVVRFNADGTLDPDFGEGRGFVRSDLNLHSELETRVSTTNIFTGIVDSQQRPVLLAGVDNANAPCYGHSGIEPTPRAVVRLTEAGQPDRSFGKGGISQLLGRPSALYAALAMTEGDRLTAVVGSSGCRGAQVYRLDAAGSPPAGIGFDGLLYRGLASGTIGSSGALALRTGEPTRRVARITPRGRVDRRFGHEGSIKVKMPSGLHRTLRPVGFDGRGRIILVGSFSRPSGSPGAAKGRSQRSPEQAYLLIMRLARSGKPDPSFGRHGRFISPVTGAEKVVVKQADLDSAGRLVVLDSSGGGPQIERVLMRYLLDG